MGVVYQNVDFSSYSASAPMCELGQEYSAQFSTARTNLDPIYPSYFSGKSQFVSDLINGLVPGLAVVNMDSDDVYVSDVSINLPTEIGQSIEGTLHLVSSNEWGEIS